MKAEDLEVEVENELPSTDEQGVPYSTIWDFFHDRYMWMGPEIDWSGDGEEVLRDEDDIGNTEEDIL